MTSSDDRLKKWLACSEEQRPEVRRLAVRYARRDGLISGLTLGMVRRPRSGWVDRALDEVLNERAHGGKAGRHGAPAADPGDARNR